jgi:hypothetical protein
MAGRVEIEEGWEPEIVAAMDKLFAERLGPAIAADARRYAPLGPSTPGPPPRTGGELRESIEDHMEGHNLVIEAHAPYAAYVELGTRPHIIRPHPRVRGGWTGPYTGKPGVGQHSMHWVGGGGEDIFAWLVHHPGTRPEPYLRTALMRVRGDD